MLVKHRGKWAVQFGNGSERRRFSTGYDATRENRAAAERAAGEIYRSLTAPDDNLVSSIVEAYLVGAEDREVIDLPRLHNAWKALKPHFGHLSPADITIKSCKAYAEKRGQDGIMDGTIIKEIGVLKAAMNAHDKYGPERYYFPTTPDPRDRYLTRKGYKKLLKAAEGVRHLEVFLRLAIATAGRKTAVLELKKSQVDFKRKKIFLGYKRKGKKRATVPLGKKLARFLREVIEENETEYLVEYNGRPIRDIKKAFHSAVHRAKLKNIVIHDIRHTSAVWMVEDGVKMGKISQYLGHSSKSVTERVYARYQPKHLKKAGQSVDV